jgi:glutamate/tyrosine decarboxylase-like PLP-dependent enzyme
MSIRRRHNMVLRVVAEWLEHNGAMDMWCALSLYINLWTCIDPRLTKKKSRAPDIIGSRIQNHLVAAVDKACEVFGICKVGIDCDLASNYTLRPDEVQKRITANTITIYASVPNPQGTIDPIEQHGELAQIYDIGLHVDACLGGFVLSFASPGTLPI